MRVSWEWPKNRVGSSAAAKPPMSNDIDDRFAGGNRTEFFSPEAGSFTRGPTLPVPGIARHCAVEFEPGGKVFLAGRNHQMVGDLETGRFADVPGG